MTAMKKIFENIVAHVDTEEECHDEHNSVDEDNEIENVGDFEQHFFETEIMSPDQIDSKNLIDLSRELQYEIEVLHGCKRSYAFRNQGMMAVTKK